MAENFQHYYTVVSFVYPQVVKLGKIQIPSFIPVTDIFCIKNSPTNTSFGSLRTFKVAAVMAASTIFRPELKRAKGFAGLTWKDYIVTIGSC